MSEAELADIITSGAEACELRFAPDAVSAIVRLSAGYPHFTHLLALKCAEEAVARESREISLSDLEHALRGAASDAEGTSRQYDNAVRSYQTDAYKIVLGSRCSAAIRSSVRSNSEQRSKPYDRDIPQQASITTSSAGFRPQAQSFAV
jgi:hypothetical protein